MHLLPDLLRAFVALGVLGAWWFWPTRDGNRFLRHVRHDDGQWDWLALRVVAAGLFAWRLATEPVLFYAGLPEGLFEPLPGWQPIAAIGYPPHRDYFRVGVGLSWALVPAIVWHRTARIAAILAAFAAVFVVGLPQFFGKVNHWHFEVWLLALVVLAPSAEASWLRGWSIRRIAMLVFACVYFFAGFGKLYEAGLTWFYPSYLLEHMHSTWFALGRYTPTIALDQAPSPILIAAATYGIGFELAYPFLVSLRRWWWTAPASSLVFHTLAGLTFGILFLPLMVAHLLYLRWGPPRARAERAVPSWVGRTLLALLFAPVLLIGGMGKVNSWPVACFPKFTGDRITELPELTMHAERGHERVDFDLAPTRAAFRGSRWSAIVRRALNSDQPARAQHALAEGIRTTLADRIEFTDGEGGWRLVITASWYSITPSAWHEPLRSEVLLEFPLE
jgi:hypothetical protein